MHHFHLDITQPTDNSYSGARRPAARWFRARGDIIEPDASAASYFFAAAAITGGKVEVPNLPCTACRGCLLRRCT